VTASPGHVFVTRGDLTRLACDAWLVPSDATRYVTTSWKHAVPPSPPPAPDDWGSHGTRVAFWTGTPAGAPIPVLTNVGGHPGTDVAWFMEGVRQFAESALDRLVHTPPLHGRARHLLAVPLVGTGGGGAAAIKGAVVRTLLATLHAVAVDRDVDVVLVTLRDGPAMTAAQSARRQLIDEGLDLWPGLPLDLAREAERLAAEARAGRLVLFLGAGVGVGAGLPLWGGLLDGLAARAGVGEEEREKLKRLPPGDCALIIKRRLADHGTELPEAVSALLKAERPSLAHQLLAGLPVNAAVTTNYDGLFQAAWVDAGRSPALLPHDPTAARDCWLLQMHGSLDRPDDIILTRDDYLGYPKEYAALEGIVQALLITRRMLFVGFSLADPNFQRIAHDVRGALGETGDKAPFATALLLRREPLLEELWMGDVDCVAMAEEASDTDTARTLELFLDRLLFCASSSTGHLLDPAFEDVLTVGERSLRDHLREFIDMAPEDAKDAEAWNDLRAVFHRLGWSGERPPARAQSNRGRNR
jgi:hypothetical protein